MAVNNCLDPDINFLNLSNTCRDSYIEVSELNVFCDFDKKIGLNIVHLNCRSLSKNFKPLLNLLNCISGALTVIALSETWLNSVNDCTFDIDGCSFVSNSRINCIGGGVGLFINNNFAYKARPELTFMTDAIESIFVETVQNNAKNIIVGCIYRPRNTRVSQFNIEMLAILDTLNMNK